MGKGNFFKKNIKKRKKERKERGIKQKILEQKKKVEEKLHHVVEVVTENQNSSEVKPVEEVKPEPVVEKPVEEVKPEPVVEKPVEETKVNYLIFDESIISYIMLDNRQVIEGIQKFSEKEIKFLTFDAVINSFIENERVTYNRILTFEQIVSKLKKIGNFQYYGFDEKSELGQRANALFNAEKYVDNSDILEEKKLSKTDCILIELLIDKSVILVTNNSLLKEATIQEAKEKNVTVNIFDPLEL